MLSVLMIQLATAELGVTETDGTNCGPRVDEFKAATWLPANQSWPWCAAFICWLIREAMRTAGKAETATFKRPRTASAWDFINWSLAQDATTNTCQPIQKRNLQAGDIVVFKIHHIGLALTAPDRGGYLYTIEGNTDMAGSREGGGVFRKRRHYSELKARIRFTI